MRQVARCFQPYFQSALLVLGTGFGILIGFFLVYIRIGYAAPNAGTATILAPESLGGASGHYNQRDVDSLPAIAYDEAKGRYLVVWMSPRNADSSYDGLDVYGLFLSRAGQPLGTEFRISDSNTAARSGFPAVAAGNSEFSVAWAVRGSRCQIVVQQIIDANTRADQLLASGTNHTHSPSLVFNPALQRYVLLFVDGDDYLPPTFSGAQTADCGDSDVSGSNIKAQEFYFDRGTLVTKAPVAITNTNSGTFRPRSAYSVPSDQYLVVWEDRRNAGGQRYRFDVYAQRLEGDLRAAEDNTVVSTNYNYADLDTSSTWTPRPAVAAGTSQFLTAWFSHRVEGIASIWTVQARMFPAIGSPNTPFTVAEMSFVQSHAGQSPTGFLATTYHTSAQEYMVGISSHLESLWGYLSLAQVQRVSTSGQLLKMDGTVQSQPAVGYSVDYSNEDQIAVGIAANPSAGCGGRDYFVVYSKHPPSQPATDLDIWGAGIQLSVTLENTRCLFLPLTIK